MANRNGERNVYLTSFGVGIPLLQLWEQSNIVEEERDELRGKFEQLYSECKEKESFFEVFLESFHHELTETIEQHEIVNSQHQELGDLIHKIKGHFDKSKRY